MFSRYFQLISNPRKHIICTYYVNIPSSIFQDKCPRKRATKKHVQRTWEQSVTNPVTTHQEICIFQNMDWKEVGCGTIGTGEYLS